jgi:fermentation-respiration switch protein FrsA (DUF1100 family)
LSRILVVRRGVVRELIRLACVLAAIYAVMLAGLYIFQRQLLYFPDRSRPLLGGLAQLGVREIMLHTADGLSLLSWYLPPRGERPVIAYFHGNGGHIGYRADRVRRLARDGYGVLMLEYRGYGGNPGSPSEAGLYQDAEAALAFLEHDGIGARRLVLYGESLGSAVAVHAAAQREIAALVLESPFTSIAAVAQHHYPYVPAALLVRDRFDALSRIGAVRAPVLMLQGGSDGVVPSRFGAALFAAAPEPKERWFAAEAGHEDLAHFGALEVVVAFIARHAG